MRKMVTSVGIVALGAASVQAAAYAPGFASTDLSQPWSISATLRGFYDDNYLTASDDSSAKRSSYGFVVSPSGSVALSTEQNELGARYTFSAYYFDDRRDDPWDFTHQFDGYWSHTFSQRFNLHVSDQFVMAQESQILDPLGSGTPYRTLGDNLRNSAAITLNAQLTRLIGLVLGYRNTIYDYQQDANDVYDLYDSVAGPFALPRYVYPSANGPYFLAGGSYSALLDRMEHGMLADLQWRLSPQTVGVLGYTFGIIDYTGDDYIAGGEFLFIDNEPTSGAIPRSDGRNFYDHKAYVGVDHTFNPDFTVAVRGGIEYADFYNSSSGYTKAAPYGNLDLRYRFGAASYIDAGFQQRFNATDVIAYNSSASIAYASVNHAFTPQLSGSVLGQYQYSEFNSRQFPGLSDYDGQSESYYLLGLNLSYRFNRHFAAEVGYNFDMLDSTLGRDFTRNRVYVGMTAAY